ncbi:hypothetical protein D3C73_1312420 [compost metagenome]
MLLKLVSVNGRLTSSAVVKLTLLMVGISLTAAITIFTSFCAVAYAVPSLPFHLKVTAPLKLGAGTKVIFARLAAVIS